MRQLVQELRELLSRAHLRGAILRELLKCRADLLADGGVGRHLVGELMQRGRDLLLLGGDLMRLPELLAEALLAGGIHAAIAQSELTLAELTLAELALAKARIAEAGITEVLTDSWVRTIAAHHSSRPEDGGRQGLSEEWCVVSIRQ